jgi:transportin-3
MSSPLFSAIFTALDSDDGFEAAVECLISMIRETRDVDDSLDSIKRLVPHVLHLQPRIKKAADEEDIETLKGLAKLFAESGEAWIVLIAREPQAFKPLVESILEICTRDWEKEAIAYTFRFWEDLKLWLVGEKHANARELFLPIYSRLVDDMIKHLEFPKPESGDETDLFEGDRNQEDRFRNYRHEMGNVLKDCGEVLGPIECLTKTYKLIEAWVGTYGSRATETSVPNWQALEAAIFALRALGEVVPSDEDVMLPRILPLLLQIPNHEKLRYQAIMALGRYTEWTSRHPDTLEPQLNFMVQAFNDPSKEVVRGATHSFQYFCIDCATLLKDFFDQMYGLYAGMIRTLQPSAAEDVTLGMAAILSQQSIDTLYGKLKKCGDPIFENILRLSQNSNDDASKFAIADNLELLKTLIQNVTPYVPPGEPHPAVRYCQEILPTLADLAQTFQNSNPILERVCSCWRHMILSYRTAAAPLLPELAGKLVAGFNATKQGCFLWSTSAIVREFSEHAEGLDPSIAQSVVLFYEQQASNFLRALSEVPAEQLPDMIEDFFRLCIDMLQNHTTGIITSNLMSDIFGAACHSLSLLKYEVLSIVLHFLRDFIAYGSSNPPKSSFSDEPAPRNLAQLQTKVKQLILANGQPLIQRMLTGMMQSFPEDCIPDASGVVLDMLKVIPQETAKWIGDTLVQLPTGTIRPQEREKLVAQISQ